MSARKAIRVNNSQKRIAIDALVDLIKTVFLRFIFVVCKLEED